MRVAIYTLGCKVNQCESWALADNFADQGVEVINHNEQADLYVVNSCAVTARAAYQSRQAIRRFVKKHPNSKVIATGCYAQVVPGDLLDITEKPVCVAGNDSKHLITDLSLKELSDDFHKNCIGMFIGDIKKLKDVTLFKVKKPRSRTRGYLKIQDGCNAFCSYCIVPYARGRSRSLDTEEVIEQVNRYKQNGVKEIIVTGIHAGLYGHDLSPSTDLFSLLQRLCYDFPDIRFRLSSIEPTELTGEMILWAEKTTNFCRHFHIPLQSGSDRILSLMNRRYSGLFFKRLVDKIRKIIPDASIGADVMAGFPSEDEDDFNQTIEILKQSPITYVHAFPYSKRPGTLADAMEKQISKKEKTKRARELRKLGNKKRALFHESQIGSTHICIAEQRDMETGLWKGFTENYLPVLLKHTENEKDLTNMMFQVVIEKQEGNHCLCRRV